MPVLKLQYFDFPFWKAEVPRIAFFVGGVEFEDERLERDVFAKMKENGETRFGQVPMLYVDKQILTQGGAISAYAGEISGLMPTNPLERARVAEVFHLVEEFIANLSDSLHEQDPIKQKELREEASKTSIPETFKKFEKLLGNDKTFFADGRLTVGDLCLWSIIHMFKSGLLDGFEPTCVDGFAGVDRNFAAVQANEKVQAWMKKHPQHYSQ